MAPSFAPNPLTILQRRDDNTPQPERPKKKFSERLPPSTPLLRKTPAQSRPKNRRPVSPVSSLCRSTTSPLLVSHRASTEEQTAASTTMKPRPTDILVLAHGFQGMVGDFNYLLESLQDTPAAKSGTLLVYASKVNEHKTHDGIILGGLRLAEDIRSVVQTHDSLTSISLVGFSLGGLYVRYAIAHLYNKEEGTIAGLRPSKVVMVAAPNLGVRNFGVYRFIPAGIRAFAGQLVLGDSIRQVYMLDEELLLERMTRDDDAPFMSALKSFEKRILYANIRMDFMVNYGTAALDTRVRGLNGEEVVRERVEQVVDKDYDDKGCKIAFEFMMTGDENASTEESDIEKVMCVRLKELGWRVVGVDFPVAWPVTHNRIVAMSRNIIHTWLNASGRRAVHHLVDTVSQDFEQHLTLFKPVE